MKRWCVTTSGLLRTSWGGEVLVKSTWDLAQDITAPGGGWAGREMEHSKLNIYRGLGTI